MPHHTTGGEVAADEQALDVVGELLHLRLVEVEAALDVLQALLGALALATDRARGVGGRDEEQRERRDKSGRDNGDGTDKPPRQEVQHE